MANLNDDIRLAAATVRRGGVILYPTDTVWGIGCDATNPEAVARVYAIKRRAEAKALIVLVGSVAALERCVDDVPDVALDIAQLATSPVTIIYDRARGLAPNLVGEDGTVGVRVTSETVSQRICREARVPLVSTSANVSGMPTPRFFDEIDEEIVGAVDYVVEARRNDRTPRRPSSIIKISADSTFKILRQ